MNNIEAYSEHTLCLALIDMCLYIFHSMAYLDKRLNQYQDLIDGCAPTSVPVILLLDNVNLYHCKRGHHRLFNVLGPKMWNFTVRGLLVPTLSEINHLFKSKETAEESQHPQEVTAEDTFIGDEIYKIELK